MNVNKEEFKTKLEEEKNTLVKDLERLGRIRDKNDNDWVAIIEPQDTSEEDPTIEADRMEEFDNNVAKLSVLESRYEEVNDALARIQDGTYGICTVGDEEHPIEAERLEANPAAKTCIEHLSE